MSEGDPAGLVRAIETGGPQLDQPLPTLVTRYGAPFTENSQIYFGKFVCGEDFSPETLDLLFHHLTARIRETAEFSALLPARYEQGFLLLADFQAQPPGLSALRRRFQSILSDFAHWIVLLAAGTPQPGGDHQPGGGAGGLSGHQIFQPLVHPSGGGESHPV